MKNKFLSLMSLILVIFAVTALSACGSGGDKKHEDEISDLFTYELSEDGSYYILTGVRDKNVKEIKIPESYKELPVREIGKDAFDGCKSLEDIEMHAGIHKIDERAFEGLDSIKFNEYDNGYYLGYKENPYLVLIKAKDTKITSCDIPRETMLIYCFAFKDCRNLETITVDRTKAEWEAIIKFNGWDDNTGDFVVICTDGRIPELHEHSFTNYVSDGNAEIGKDGTKTAKCDGCDETDTITDEGSALEEIKYSEGLAFTINSDGESYSVTGIGTCTDTNVVIPATYNGLPVTSIGWSAFRDCSGLTNITIPNSVISIGNYAFSNCAGLTSVTIPNSVTSISFSAFSGCTGLTSITIPYSVTSIGSDAFYNCTGLTSITIPNSVTSIGSSAFYWCTGLTSITIPDSVTSIGGGAFYNCTGLTSITIPNSVTSIGSSAFYWCTGLTSITVDSENTVYHSNGNCVIETVSKTLILGCKNSIIPTDNSVTSIGDYAFWDCTGLTSITIPNSVTSIGYYAFRNCPGLTSINIPDSVTSIGMYAFENCTGLTSINIPSSLTSIAYGVFWGCSGLESVTVDSENTRYHSEGNCIVETESKTLILGCKNSIIPTDNSVTSIGDSAFYGCTGLTSVTIPNSVTSIGKYAFLGCTGLTSITIPDSVTSIGGSAFYNCAGLTSITIPSSVTSIGARALFGCKGITNINFNGTTDGWTNIKKEANWNSDTGEYTVYCSDGTVAKDGTVTKS